MMRKRNTTRLASLRRPCTLLFRLSLLAAIWHAPLPTIHWHAEADDHDVVPHAADSSHRSKMEIEFVLPCQLNGCEHASPHHSDEPDGDHSTHIAAVGYGLLGDADVDLIDCGFDVDQLALSTSTGLPLQSWSLFEPATQTAGIAVPSLPLRAHLQVFRI